MVADWRVNVYQPADPAHAKNPLQDAVITALAEKHRKTPAQVILRWQLQLGNSAIPRSVRPQRIGENFELFDFQLTDEEVAAIDAPDTGVRGGPDPRPGDTGMFPFTIDN